MKSIEVAKDLAVRILERENPDEAIRQAVTNVVTGLHSLKRLGFSEQEILAAYQKEVSKRSK